MDRSGCLLACLLASTPTSWSCRVVLCCIPGLAWASWMCWSIWHGKEGDSTDASQDCKTSPFKIVAKGNANAKATAQRESTGINHDPSPLSFLASRVFSEKPHALRSTVKQKPVMCQVPNRSARCNSTAGPQLRGVIIRSSYPPLRLHRSHLTPRVQGQSQNLPSLKWCSGEVMVRPCPCSSRRLVKAAEPRYTRTCRTR